LDSHPDILCTCCVLAFGTRRLTALDSVGALKMNVWILGCEQESVMDLGFYENPRFLMETRFY
jgi:hypothetical protein